MSFKLYGYQKGTSRKTGKEYLRVNLMDSIPGVNGYEFRVCFVASDQIENVYGFLQSVREFPVDVTCSFVFGTTIVTAVSPLD